jgi:hypothetical protein
MKKILKLLTLTVIIVTIIPCIPKVSTTDNSPMNYQGEVKPDSSEWPPTIAVKLPDGRDIYLFSNKDVSLKDE